MPLTTFTGVSAAEEVVPTETLTKVIDEFEYGPRVGMIVGGVVGGRGNVPQRFGRWNSMSLPAGSDGIAETVDAPDANVDMTESSCTPAMIRFRMPISDELEAAAETGIPAGVLAAGLELLMDEWETDVLAVSTGATNTTSATTADFELPEFRAMRQAYRALEIEKYGMPALVLHDDALNPLENSIDTSGSPYTLKIGDTLRRELGPAYQGRLAGFEVFRAPNVAVEGAGRSNFATPMGLSGGLISVLNEAPSVRMTRGDVAENRASTFWHFRLWKGQAIRNPRRFLEVLSS